MAIEAQMYSENLGFQLCGSADWMAANGCGGGGFSHSQFSFNVQQLQQHQQQHQLQNQQHVNHNFCFNNTFIEPTLENTNMCTSIMAPYSQAMEAQAAKQGQEIDHYIRLQNERLRLVIEEQKKQQLSLLLKKIESKTQSILKEKDDEITQANKRRMELEEFMRRLEAENQAWQRVAQENEAMVLSLNNTLEQLRERANGNGDGCLVNAAEDTESCCDNREEEAQSNGNGNGVDEQEQMIKTKVCKSCHFRSSCVLFLPCRHLCSCKACEAGLDSCPLCLSPKKASIEALIF